MSFTTEASDGNQEEKVNSQVIKWDSVIDIGEPVAEKPWCAGKFRFNNAYKAKRLVTAADGTVYKVVCSVHASVAMNKPIFECSIYQQDSDKLVHKITSLKSTAVANGVLKYLNVKTKRRWPGPQFFGITRKDVIELLGNQQKERVNVDCLQNLDLADNSRDDIPKLQDGFIGSRSAFLGVVDFGDLEKDFVLKTSGVHTFKVPAGYHAKRSIRLKGGKYCIVSCMVKMFEGGMLYSCKTYDPELQFYATTPSKVVAELFSKIDRDGCRIWSGYDFFGFLRAEVLSKLEVLDTNQNLPDSDNNQEDDVENDNVSSENEFLLKKRKGQSFKQYEVLDDIAKIRTRNAGPTSELKKRSAQKERNKSIHELVRFASFDDVKSYVVYLTEEHPEIVDEGIEANESYKHHILKKLRKCAIPVKLSAKESAELLLGKCMLSERSYKGLRKVLKKKKVYLCRYEEARNFCNTIDVGNIVFQETCKDRCSNKTFCMCASSSCKETLLFIFKTKKLFDEMNFPSQDSQKRLFELIKQKNYSLYSSLDPKKRTIFLRETGDNFRAAGRFPTEQTSFALLNLTKFLDSPYGQFLTTLWRGSESRKNLEVHVKTHYDALRDLVKNGIQVETPNGDLESFNVIVFLVTDLGLLKDILGKCATNGLFGCYWCKKNNLSWTEIKPSQCQSQTVAEFCKNGQQAVKVLGKNPSHSSSDFTAFQQSHYGQWAPPLFNGFIIETMIPCGLHLILANHRYLWRFLYDVINKRGQDNMLSDGLRNIGCGYLAFQLDSYFKSKKKYYDGSESLKMIGNDCKLFEKNIDKFLTTFLKKDKGETWKSGSFLKMRQVADLYHQFGSLARDIRDKSPKSEQVITFKNRAEKFFQSLKKYAGGESTSKLIYLHILRDHISDTMAFWYELFGWGYGYFSCTAGEHLNKRCKELEREDTNQDDSRFTSILRMFRVKQFYYTDSIFPTSKVITCSSCKNEGHNKKNKSCPLHPSQPPLYFPDSDNED